MNFTKDKGITLIGLVITIIILLILAGVSISTILDENGILAKAQEASMLTKLSDIIFNIESDLLETKMEHFDKKLPTTAVLEVLSTLKPDTYHLNIGGNNNIGLSTLNLFLKDSPIPNLTFSLTGDVYVDNYKRNKIQFSDIYEEREAKDLWYGNSNIKINDGSIHVDNNDFVTATYFIDYINMPWINSNNEIVAWTNNYTFFPTGITNYDIATYDASWLDNIHDMVDNRYAIFTTVNCTLKNNNLLFENQVFHFLKTTTTQSGLKYGELNGEPIEISNTLTFGGTYITKAGILLSDNPEDFSGGIVITLDIPQATYPSQNNYSINETFAYEYENIENTLKEHSITGSRIYYTPYITYKKYAYDDSETGEALYYSTESIYLGGTVKYFDLK